MAEKEVLRDKGKTSWVRKPAVNQTEPAGQEQEPPFPVPPHLDQADPATIVHMQRTLGNKAVQRYLEAKEKKGSPNPFFGLQVNPDLQAANGRTASPIQRMLPPQGGKEIAIDDTCLTPPASGFLPQSADGGKMMPPSGTNGKVSDPAAGNGGSGHKQLFGSGKEKKGEGGISTGFFRATDLLP